MALKQRKDVLLENMWLLIDTILPRCRSRKLGDSKLTTLYHDTNNGMTKVIPSMTFKTTIDLPWAVNLNVVNFNLLNAISLAFCYQASATSNFVFIVIPKNNYHY